MGLFGGASRKKPLTAQELYDKYQGNRLWGGAFLTIGELYQAFANEDLNDDDIVTFALRNNRDHVVPAEIGGEAGAKCYFEDDGSSFPTFAIDDGATAPLKYGELMKLLKGKGDELGWENYPYKITLYYRVPVQNKSFLFRLLKIEEDPFVNECTPLNPTIRIDPDDPCTFIIRGEKWNNAGSGGHEGDPWGGYVAL